MSTTVVRDIGSADGSRSEFAAFLRMMRRRVPATAITIGACERPATRYGRRVTQEEAAELIGVSRTWYRMLENGANVRASIRLIDRLAKAFAFTEDERLTLFVLAIPELRGWDHDR